MHVNTHTHTLSLQCVCSHVYIRMPAFSLFHVCAAVSTYTYKRALSHMSMQPRVHTHTNIHPPLCLCICVHTGWRRPIGYLIFFLVIFRKIFNGSFAKNHLGLKASYGSSLLCTHTGMYFVLWLLSVQLNAPTHIGHRLSLVGLCSYLRTQTLHSTY